MLKNNIFAFLLCMFVFSCTQTESINNQSDKYPDLFSIDIALINNGVLKVNLPQDRPKNMSIMSPNGTWFVVQNKEESIEAIPNEQFIKNSSIEFIIPKLIGTTWRKGIKYNEKVFSAKGEYFIYFANNLETEPENTFSFGKKITYSAP